MMRNRQPYAMRMNEGLIEKLRKHEAKKEKAIEPILTPEQKILFKQLKEVRHKELEMILEKLRQERNSQ
jgi:DNA-binding MarR family transcriptional regulator